MVSPKYVIHFSGVAVSVGRSSLELRVPGLGLLIKLVRDGFSYFCLEVWRVKGELFSYSSKCFTYWVCAFYSCS